MLMPNHFQALISAMTIIGRLGPAFQKIGLAEQTHAEQHVLQRPVGLVR